MDGIPTVKQPNFPEKFKKVSGYWSVEAILFDWGVIIGACLLVKNFGWILYAPAICLIASRQHALFLLMHEGAHRLLFKTKVINDWASNLFAAWPIGLSTENFRNHHWKHHNNTNTDKDPDWVRKVTHPDWIFPRSKASFWLSFLPYFYGKGVSDMRFAWKVIGFRKNTKELKQVAIFYTLIFATFLATKSLDTFLLFWIVPYFTVLPVLNRVRSIVEHLGTPNKSALDGTRNIEGSPLESFFFGPHGNSLHLIHHMYPNIPWHKIAKAHEHLKTIPEYKNHSHLNRGYFLPNPNSAFRELTKIESKEIRNEQKLSA